MPFAIGSFILSNNFWGAIVCLALKYLAGEAWGSPAVTMMQNITPSNEQGFMISAYLLFTTLAGTFATAICGFLAQAFKAGNNATILGRIICALELISLGGSIYFFRKAGKFYK